jgi:CHASE3 domain sensor protein
MDSQRLPRIFMLSIILFVFFLMVFYVNEQQQELTHPYSVKIGHKMQSLDELVDGENLLSLMSDKSDNVQAE